MTVVQHTTAPAETPPQVSAPVTLVMSDVVGSTRISVEQGDAWYLRVMDRHDRVMRGALHQFGGREIDHVGDGLLMAFSDPNDAAHYCQAVSTAAARCSSRRLQLAIRLGITIGSPLQRGARLYGAAVNLASRLSSINSLGGRPLMSEGVRRRLDRAITTESLGRVSLKGFPRPIPLHALADARSPGCQRRPARWS